jgi:Putative transposase
MLRPGHRFPDRAGPAAGRPGRDATFLEASGFSLYRSRRVEPEEGEHLEQMARYILRNPFSTAKMHFEPGAGSVLYRSRMNTKQGGNFAARSPTDFIAAVSQHIPDKGFQLSALLRLEFEQGSRCPGKTGACTGPGRWHRPNRIVRPPPPSGTGSLRRYGNPSP